MSNPIEKEIPSKCPNIGKCTEKVIWATYEVRCNSSNWILCSKMKAKAEKYLKRPYEWKFIEKLKGDKDQ